MLRLYEWGNYDKWERKQQYVNARNKENREIVGNKLTEEQIEALEDLASIRHEIHSNWDDMWNVDSGDYEKLWDYLDDDYSNTSINQMLQEAGLPTISFGDIYGIPNSNWYYEDEDEQVGYEDSWDWRENSGRYDEFANWMNEINNKIEKYLQDIDSKYGTSYAPTGYARINY